MRSLRLDDIDWRSDCIRIANRKAGNCTDYPLSASVGEAILDYLRGGRPVSACREVFLMAIAPIKPLTRPEPIAYQVRKYLTRAGITIEHPGTHSFRYSCAQRLLEEGTPLKTIGDYLGHTHPDSTQERYLKIAIDQLRRGRPGRRGGRVMNGRALPTADLIMAEHLIATGRSELCGSASSPRDDPEISGLLP